MTPFCVKRWEGNSTSCCGETGLDFLRPLCKFRGYLPFPNVGAGGQKRVRKSLRGSYFEVGRVIKGTLLLRPKESSAKWPQTEEFPQVHTLPLAPGVGMSQTVSAPQETAFSLRHFFRGHSCDPTSTSQGMRVQYFSCLIFSGTWLSVLSPIEG